LLKFFLPTLLFRDYANLKVLWQKRFLNHCEAALGTFNNSLKGKRVKSMQKLLSVPELSVNAPCLRATSSLFVQISLFLELPTSLVDRFAVASKRMEGSKRHRADGTEDPNEGASKRS